MADPPFVALSPEERIHAIETAALASGGKPFLLEKDIWVVAVLQALFSASFAPDLVFKGGTSLSKVWRAITRFSEDVDVTYSIRAIAPDLMDRADHEALPPTRSQEQRWTKAIRARLTDWVRERAHSAIEAGLARTGFDSRVSCHGDRVHVDYEPLFQVDGFVRPQVIVEFGARSTGEPHEIRSVECDAAPHLSGIALPVAGPRVMKAERTFWEKITSMHVFCRRGRGRGDRLARHWHDVVSLDRTGFAGTALADRALALQVARHKAIFFREKDAGGNWVNYEAAVSGGLQIVPVGSVREALAEDYRRMVGSGMMPLEAEPFDEIMDGCADIERRANDR